MASLTSSRPSDALRLDLTTGEMLRAGRAISRVEQSELADAAGVSLETVKRLERIRGPVNASRRTLRALMEAFELLGVRFFNDGAGRECVCLGPAGQEAQWVQVEPPPEEPAVIFRAIYHSVAAVECAASLRAALDDILLTATGNNAPLGLTGALLAVDGRFLQVLEGPRDSVLQMLGRIAMDGRHHRFTPLDCAPADGRRFGDWLMAGHPSAPGLAAPSAFAPESLSVDAALDLLLGVSAAERTALDQVVSFAVPAANARRVGS